MKEQTEPNIELSEIETLQNKRNFVHKKAVEASTLEITAFEEDSKQKNNEISQLSKAARENEKTIRDSYPYRRAEADAFNDRLAGFKNQDHQKDLLHYKKQIIDGYKPVTEAKEKKGKIDEKINSYYHSTSDIDELNSKITTRLNSSIKNSTDKIRDLEKKINKEKENIEVEIQRLTKEIDNQKQIENQNKAIFYGQTKKEIQAKTEQEVLRNQINELTSKFKEISSPNNENNKNLETERQNLEKAQELLVNEKDKQNAIKKERDNFPKEMDLKKCLSELSEGIKDFGNKTQKEKEDFLITIHNTSPLVLATKLGDPPKTLLNLASELKQKEVASALLNTDAKFTIQDMKEALKNAQNNRTTEQNKVLSTHNENLTHEDVKEATKSAIHSMRDSLSSQPNQPPPTLRAIPKPTQSRSSAVNAH